jgi:hypothetical protein
MIHGHLLFLNMKESEIIEEAIANFKKITGADITTQLVEDNKNEINRIIDLKFENQVQEFHIQVKNEIRSLHLPKIIHQLKNGGLDWILMAQYIPSPLKEELREEKINYLEATGNCYIKTNNFYFFINDKKVTETRLPKEGKLWNATGMKFLFTILTDHKLIEASQREIATMAGIALGNVGPLLAEMQKEGYTTLSSKKEVIIDELALRDKWVDLYSSVLRPKLKIGRFKRMHNSEDWKKIDNKTFLWGGENAGAVLTDYLTPEIYTMYTKENKQVIMKDQKLIPDPNGNIDLMQQFWADALQKNQKYPKVVPPLIAYAELATDRDSRNQETAERIKAYYLN